MQIMPFFTVFVYLSAYLTTFLIAPTANAAIITQTHTLYYVPQPTTTDLAVSWEIHETTAYIPLATLEGGSVTQYQKVNVQSLAVVHNLSPTNTIDPTAITIISQPVTRTVTFEEGSATFQQSVPPSTKKVGGGVVQRIFAATENCSHNIPQKAGACVRVGEVPWVDVAQSTGGVSTVTESWSGSLVPYATITSTAEATSGSVSRTPACFGIALSGMAALTGALLL
ncbi:hypothetical protein D9619_004643 [Psilocybe cf. subviscida]|uniref:Uncharacterized protein n=1 Tax=Psilocybe cf. subviscida TaxID=2480587 RepID=A0A8H5BRX7_9AGAR|nr:hypothetical protein D9619_004643 [Psilocybe cf. subviscida]